MDIKPDDIQAIIHATWPWRCPLRRPCPAGALRPASARIGKPLDFVLDDFKQCLGFGDVDEGTTIAASNGDAGDQHRHQPTEFVAVIHTTYWCDRLTLENKTMLMVIFGAGASYDSCSSFPPQEIPFSDGLRLPLANQLFRAIDPFRAISKTYSPCQPLFPYLESHSNIEEELEKFRARAESDPDTARQLLALQYYIRDVIRECESRWSARTHGVSNYKTLLDQIRTHPEVCFVTFNYDTLLEIALAGIGVQIPNIAAYVSIPKYQLFKLHGSTNWQRCVLARNTTINISAEPGDDELLYSSPNFDHDSVVNKIGDPFQTLSPVRYYAYPALAIPTVSKSSFICPDEHIRILKEFIPKVTRILIVGWRGAERHFLEMLADGLPKPVRVMAVCESPQASQDTLDQLSRAGIDGRMLAAGGGFTEFVKQRRSEWLMA